MCVCVCVCVFFFIVFVIMRCAIIIIKQIELCLNNFDQNSF